MLAFRSEEHVDRWCAERGLARGAVFPGEQAWALAAAWYSDRLSPDWRRPAPAEVEELFASLGLTGPFWSVRG